MKTLRSTLLTSIAVLFLLGGTTAAFADTGQTYNLTVPLGYVTNLGNQTYTVNGGTNYGGMIEGQQLNPGGNLQYNLFVVQNGMSTYGWGAIRLTGTTGTGTSVKVTGTFTVDSAIAAGVIGSSELPIYFIASAPNIQVTVGGSTTSLSMPLLIESPYWNPWGGPITITSEDGTSLLMAATYNVGNIIWQGSQVAGPLSVVGSTAAPGTFSLTTLEFENLVTGTARDTGTVSITGMTPSSLDGQGTFSGSSTIPTSPSEIVSCDATFGTIPGTCNATSFYSTGHFRAGDVSGTYTTQWGLPATYFTTSETVTVSQHGNDQGGRQQGGFFGLSDLFGFFGF